MESRLIRCFIFQCKDIPSADADGKSDAQISIWTPYGENSVKTKIVEDSLNPIYFETIDILYDVPDSEHSPPIIMDVWDKDENLLSDSFDFLGRCTVFLDKASIIYQKGDPKKDKNER
jgi:Ca2+-dependent lipid-binding protein